MCYDVAGVPSQKEVNNMLDILLDKNINFNKSYEIVTNMIKSQGYALSTVLKEMILVIINNENILKNMASYIAELSDLENMVTKSTFGDIYITALIGIFKKYDT